ncbi:hypothetical protein ACHAWF_010657 [Thalassiosira exigua]
MMGRSSRKNHSKAAKRAKIQAEQEERRRRLRAELEAKRQIYREKQDERIRRRGENPMAPRHPDQGSQALVAEQAMDVKSGGF